jgi:zinc protease
MSVNQPVTEHMKLFSLGAVFLLLFSWSLSAQAMSPIQHWQTDNGARVYYVPAPELPMADVNVTFAAGSARDGEHAGLAHMTSTLLDNGAAGLSADELATRIEALGAQLETGSARDMAWVSLRSLSDANHLQPALDIMGNVLGKPDFNKVDFERERDRTIVAIRSSEQSPSTVAEHAWYRSVYGSHPYAERPSGTEDTLRAIQLEQLRAFHKRYYVARNAVIAIVGDLDRKAAEKLADNLAAQLPEGKRAEPLPVPEPLREAKEKRIFHPSAQTHVYMGAPGMRRGDPDYFALYVGNHVLGGSGLVSRLSEEIREKRGLSYSVYSYFSPMEQNGPYLLSLQTRNDQVDEALAVMRNTLKKYVEEGPTEKELVASKKNITGGFALRIDSNSKILDYLVVIGFYDLPLDYLEVFNDRVMAVTREQIIDAFQRRVMPDAMSTVIVGGDSDPA